MGASEGGQDHEPRLNVEALETEDGRQTGDLEGTHPGPALRNSPSRGENAERNAHGKGEPATSQNRPALDSTCKERNAAKETKEWGFPSEART